MKAIAHSVVLITISLMSPIATAADLETWGNAITLGAEFDSGHVLAICPDGDDRIWALSYGLPKTSVTLPNGLPAFPSTPPYNSAWLVTYEHDTWRVAIVGENVEFGNLPGGSFGQGPDGSLLFFNKVREVIQLRGLRGRRIPRPVQTEFQVDVEFAKDSKGMSWMATGDLQPFLIKPLDPGHARLLFPKHSLVADSVLQNFGGFPLPAPVAADAWDRIWLPLLNPSGEARMAGIRATAILTADATTHPPPPAVAPMSCSAMDIAIIDPSGTSFVSDGPPLVCQDAVRPTKYVRKNDRTMWAITKEGAIAEVDIATCSAIRSTSDREPPMNLSFFTSLGGTWFAYGPTSVWRLSGDVWKSIAFPGAGSDARSGSSETRIVKVLAIGSDVWAITTYSPSLWYIRPDANEAAPLDWRHGFSHLGIEALLPCEDGKALLIGGSVRGAISTSAAEMRSLAAGPALMEILNPKTRLLQDDAYRLYTLNPDNARALKRWDGSAWEDLAFPAASPAAPAQYLARDSAARIWALAEDPKAPVPVFESQTDTWRVYDSFDAGVSQSFSDGIRLLECTDPGRMPVKGPGGGFAFYTQQRVYACNGTVWKSWDIRKDIVSEGNVFDRACFFNPEGRLCVGTWKETWECGEQDQWRAIPFAPGPGSWKDLEQPLPQETPAAIKDNVRKTPAIPDRLGRNWNLWSGRLFRSGYGTCVGLLNSARFTELDELPPMDAALIDPAGNCFLHFERDGNRYLKFAPRESAPNTTIKSQEHLGASATLILEPPPPGCFQTARIDGKNWSKVGSGTIVSFTNLPAGKHRIEVTTVVGDDLLADPTPATYLFDTSSRDNSTAPPIAAWIANLRANDFKTRNDAIESLCRFPDASLPFLRSSRDAATTDDERWWRETALQRVLDAMKSAPRKGEGSAPTE